MLTSVLPKKWYYVISFSCETHLHSIGANTGEWYLCLWKHLIWNVSTSDFKKWKEFAHIDTIKNPEQNQYVIEKGAGTSNSTHNIILTKVSWSHCNEADHLPSSNTKD